MHSECVGRYGVGDHGMWGVWTQGLSRSSLCSANNEENLEINSVFHFTVTIEGRIYLGNLGSFQVPVKRLATAFWTNCRQDSSD